MFSSPDEIFEFYKVYGLQEGFPVMQKSCKKGDDGSMSYVTFTCVETASQKEKPIMFCSFNLTKKLDAMLKLEDVWIL